MDASRARVAAAKVKRMTFGEYSAAWLPARKTKGRPLADRTRDHYQDLLDRFILRRSRKSSSPRSPRT
jgi:hypothetical protein